MWALIYQRGNAGKDSKKTKSPFQWELDQDGLDNRFVQVPDEIYTTRCFFPAHGSTLSSTKPINLLAGELAQSLAVSPPQQEADWFAWISDPYQIGAEARWLSLEAVNDKSLPPAKKTQTKFALAYLFWKGLHLYLGAEDRWHAYNARYLYLVSTWQWFHLARWLAGIWLDAKNKPGQNSDTGSDLRWLHNELILATRTLQDLLQDPEFRYPILALAHQLTKSAEPNTEPAPAGTSDDDLRKLAHQLTKSEELNTELQEFSEGEQLLYAMLLDRKDNPADDVKRWETTDAFQMIGGDRPIYDPYKQENRSWNFNKVIESPIVSRRFKWAEVHLHPVFCVSENWNLQSFVRLVIRRWLLPRYDFTGALHLTILLRSTLLNQRSKAVTQTQPEKWFRDWVIYAAFWAVWLSVDVVLPPILQWTAGVKIWYGMGQILIGGFVYWGLILCGIWLIWHRFDQQVYQYLLLPRLLGGILVGYAGLVLSADSLVLKNALFAQCLNETQFCWENILLTGLLWVAVLVIGGWYFYYECLARIQHKAISRRRSAQLLFISTFSSTFIGLFATSLTTAMEWQSQACQVHGMLCPVQGYFLVGPIGVIDVRQFFVFIPMAMLTGFISQFLFEEKPITASVWEE